MRNGDGSRLRSGADFCFLFLYKKNKINYLYKKIVDFAPIGQASEDIGPSTGRRETKCPKNFLFKKIRIFLAVKKTGLPLCRF
jgi:hypothetical protein